MYNIIIAMTKNGGIGYNGKLPWKLKEELEIFKKKTIGKKIVVGRKTLLSLPKLEDRKIICISSDKNIREKIGDKNEVIGVYSSLKMFIENNKDYSEDIFICGGSMIYNEFLSEWRHLIKSVHLSVMQEKDTMMFDTFVDFSFYDWTVIERKKYNDFTHYVLSPKISSEKNYLKLLKNVLNKGNIRSGRNGETKSLFGKTIKFDLTHGFPLLTTKKMFFRGVFEELIFFIKGETDSKILENKKINIWKGNTNREFLNSINKTERKEGIMGPMYGYQWRFFNSKYGENSGKPLEPGIDQLKNVIKNINNNPHSRRIMMTTYNPVQVEDGVLPPCHSIVLQFYVDGDFLDMYCYNRSSDLFHGLPFNIASSSLLLIFISKICGLTPRNFILSLGDVHIYNSHYNVVKEQLERIPYDFPILEINKNISSVEDIENLNFEDLVLKNYNYYPTLKAEMVS